MTNKVIKIIFSIFTLISLCSCSILTDKTKLKETEFVHLPGWYEGKQSEIIKPFKKSCDKIYFKNKEEYLHPVSKVGGKFEKWQEVCSYIDNFHMQNDEYSRQYFENFFTPYLVKNRWKKKGIFTGYYEIELKGNLHQTDKYKYPIYKKPFDLKDNEKYYSRKKIDKGALAGRGLEIAWVADPVRLFFLHIQGSGKIVLENGERISIGYNGKNGHEYKSIGRYMIDKGYIDENKVSAELIKSYLYKNPHRAKEIMEYNPSYVFFRQISEDGPIGAQGVALTPERSLAVDKSKLPYGIPIWMDLELTTTPNYPAEKFNRLVVSQDTGGAIRGSVRGDIFFGAGQRAEELASYQKNEGSYYILLPKD